MTSRVLALAVGVALVAVAAVPAVASASTISGRVAGAKLPKAGKGFSTVRAVRAKDLVILDVAKVRSGRFKLEVPAGSYWLLGATIPFRGKAGVDPGGTKVAVRKGKRKSVRVSLRKRKRRFPKVPKAPNVAGFPSPASAHAAFVNVKHPAVWVQHFSVSGPAELSVLRKGLADMLITDLLPIKQACNGVIVEREKLDWLIAEQLFSQSPAADPSTRLPTDKMIAHNREVTGSLTVAGPTMTLKVVVKNVVTGTTRSVTRSAPNDRFFELEQSVVQETIRLICGDKPPAAYSGPASGSVSASDGSTFQKQSWSGNVRLKYTGDLDAESSGEPPGEYALYAAESGGFHLIVDGNDGQCAYHGETDITLAPVPGEYSRVQQGVDEPTYSLSASFGPALVYVPVTKSAPCGDTIMFPFLGSALAMPEIRRSPSSALVGTSTHVVGPATIESAWSLEPQAR